MINKNFYFFIGTTAEFIKLAPIIKTFKKRNIKFKIIASGQNQIDFQELRNYTGHIDAHINFPKKTAKSSIIGFFIWTIKTFFLALSTFRHEVNTGNQKKSYLLIHGDTISSLVGAVAGKICGFKIVQIEAGLRSFNLLEPFPEEICRLIITKIADILFAPNNWAVKNLHNALGQKIDTKQNTLIESCFWAINKNTDNDYIKRFKNYYILFIHRQEHIYFNQNWTRDIINTIINKAPKKLNCVLVMHALTSRILTSGEIDQLSRVRNKFITLPKLPYIDFINLVKHAEFIATDSCTNQEEASYLGVPYLGLRNLTERIEGLQQNVVISKGNKQVINNFLRNYKKYKRKPLTTKKRPSEIIVNYLTTH